MEGNSERGIHAQCALDRSGPPSPVRCPAAAPWKPRSDGALSSAVCACSVLTRPALVGEEKHLGTRVSYFVGRLKTAGTSSIMRLSTQQGHRMEGDSEEHPTVSGGLGRWEEGWGPRGGHLAVSLSTVKQALSALCVKI